MRASGSRRARSSIRRGARHRRGEEYETQKNATRVSRITVSLYPFPVKRLRVGVIYGGRSGEHEVSLASAAAVFANLDRTRYEPVPIRIEKDGKWSLADRPPTAVSAADVIEQSRIDAARPSREGREVHFMARPTSETILSIDRRTAHAAEGQAVVTGLSLDVIFP